MGAALLGRDHWQLAPGLKRASMGVDKHFGRV
jgi:hypothetical protein